MALTSGTIDLGKKELNRFFASGIGGAGVARNPERFPNVALVLEQQASRFIGQQGFVPQDIKRPSVASQVIPGSLTFDFHSAEQALRRNFTDAQIERQFGPQNITSVSSTVGPGGVRTPIAGQRTSTAPTSAQREEIAAGFQTPTEIFLLRKVGKSKQIRTQPAAPAVALRDPTIISGAGIQRRRAGGAPKPTILTSDADSPIGERTLLG